jgi:ketosteroid isomerase-like protein
MKTTTLVSMCLLLLASACSSGTTVAPPAEDPEDEAGTVQEIESILETYDRAVSAMDLDLFMTIIDPRGVSIVSPVGRVSSTAELEEFFEMLRTTYSELDLVFENATIRTDGSAAWATFDWTADAVLTDGPGIQFGGWETQIYRRTDEGWRIVHVHYSVPPAPSPVEQ